jgi:hypothetical protein
MRNLYLVKCCGIEILKKFLSIIDEEFDKLLDEATQKELFGDKEGLMCVFDRINDFAYLNQTLDAYLEEQVNNEFAPDYGEGMIPSDDILKAFCFRKTYEYFHGKGFDISRLLDVYGINVLTMS